MPAFVSNVLRAISIRLSSNLFVLRTGMTQLSRLALLRRIRLLRETALKFNSDPAVVAGTALRMWCRMEFPAAPTITLPHCYQLEVSIEIREFVGVLRSMNFLDAAFWLSSTYAILTNEACRKQLAMYFTPTPLTSGFLDELNAQGADFGKHSFLDPACGGAAFLAAIALRMQQALRTQGLSAKACLKHIEQHLFGIDKEPFLCTLSHQFLCMVLHNDIEESGYCPRFAIDVGDSLQSREDRLARHDVVVCNPPYRKIGAAEVAALDRPFEQIFQGQPNLYGAFVFQCVRLVRPRGIVALLTPTSFLSGQHFARLRTFLIRNAEVEHIAMVADRQRVFIDVEQETALTILRRHATAEDRTQASAKVSVVSIDGTYAPIGTSVLPGGGGAWPIPRTTADVALLKRAAATAFRFADYGYKVRIGAYVWNRDTRPKYETLSDVHRAKATTAVPLVWSRDISHDGRLDYEPDLKVGGHHFVDFGDKLHSAVVRQPCVVMQRVTSNDQSRRLVAAPVPKSIFMEYGGFVGENHIVIIEQMITRPLLRPRRLSQLLQTKSVDRIYRCISGTTNISVYELSQLPLPDPVKLTRYLSQGNSMEEAAARAYGLEIVDTTKQTRT